MMACKAAKAWLADTLQSKKLLFLSYTVAAPRVKKWPFTHQAHLLHLGLLLGLLLSLLLGLLLGLLHFPLAQPLSSFWCPVPGRRLGQYSPALLRSAVGQGGWPGLTWWAFCLAWGIQLLGHWHVWWPALGWHCASSFLALASCHLPGKHLGHRWLSCIPGSWFSGGPKRFNWSSCCSWVLGCHTHQLHYQVPCGPEFEELAVLMLHQESCWNCNGLVVT